MTREILTKNAPEPGNYSQAIKIDVGTGYMVYLAGQTGNLPSGQLVEGGIGPQTSQAIRNLEAVLNEAGGGLKHVVKTTLYLGGLEANWAACQESYLRAFSESGVPEEKLPVRSSIQAVVPFQSDGNLVEIDAIAFLPHKESRSDLT